MPVSVHCSGVNESIHGCEGGQNAGTPILKSFGRIGRGLHLPGWRPFEWTPCGSHEVGPPCRSRQEQAHSRQCTGTWEDDPSTQISNESQDSRPMSHVFAEVVGAKGRTFEGESMAFHWFLSPIFCTASPLAGRTRSEEMRNPSPWIFSARLARAVSSSSTHMCTHVLSYPQRLSSRFQGAGVKELTPFSRSNRWASSWLGRQWLSLK